MYPIYNKFSLILHGQKERGKNRTCTLHSLLLDHTFSLVLIFTRFSHTSLFNSQLTNHHSTQVHWPTISIFPALITCSKTICSFNFQASEVISLIWWLVFKPLVTCLVTWMICIWGLLMTCSWCSAVSILMLW